MAGGVRISLSEGDAKRKASQGPYALTRSGRDLQVSGVFPKLPVNPDPASGRAGNCTLGRGWRGDD